MNVTDVMCLITHRLMMSCVYLISCVISGNSTCSRWSGEVSYFVMSLKLKRIEGFKSWKWISFLFKSESVRAGFPVGRRGRRDESEDTARTWQWWECWCDPHGWNGIIPTDSDQNTDTDLSGNCSTRFLFFLPSRSHWLATNTHYIWLCFTSSTGVKRLLWWLQTEPETISQSILRQRGERND